MNDDRITEVYRGDLGSPRHQQAARERIHWMCSRAAGERVLDIGCSQGISTLLLAREGREVVGLDNEQGAIDFANGALAEEEPAVRARARFVLGESASLPFEAESFDAALLGEVLEHQVDPASTLAEAARVLRPGGRLVITTPYGIFRFPDHKEPVYLEPLLALLRPHFAVAEVELLDHYLAIVARRGAAPAEDPATLRAALSVAERRLIQVDRRAEELKRTAQRRKAQLREKGTGSAPDAELRSLRRQVAQAADEIDRLRERAAAAEAGRRDAEAQLLALTREAARLRTESTLTGRRPADPTPERPADPDPDPEDAEALLRRSVEQRRAKATEDALVSARRAVSLRPDWDEARWQALTVAAECADRLRAFRELAAPLPPIAELDDEPLERLATLAGRAGDWELAGDAGEELIRRDRLETGVFAVCAAAWEQGDEAEAVARSERHGNGAATLGRARFLLHLDRPVDAAALLQDAGEVHPKLLVQAARALVDHGEPRRALDLAGGALAHDPGHDGALAVRLQALSDLRLMTATRTPNPRRKGTTATGQVLHLVQRSLPHHQSGGTVRTHYTARAQRRAGLHPHVVTELGFPWSRGAESAPVFETIDGVPYYRLRDERRPSRLDDRLAVTAGLVADLVEQVRPSVLHPSSDYHQALVAMDLRERFDIPVVFEVRGLPGERRVRRGGSRIDTDPYGGRRALESRSYDGADHVVTLAEVMKAHLVTLGVPGDKVTVIPNAVDAERFTPGDPDPALADSLGLPRAATVIGYVSTLNPYEGIDVLIEAIAQLVHNGRDVAGLIVGDGSERDRLIALARERGVADRVVFTGRVPHDDVPRHYALIDVFVVPRRDEPICRLVTPLKPYEAMAAGCAVVVSDVPALREMVDDGETGLTFEADRADSLAGVLDGLVGDPSRRAELAAAARAWVSRERSWASNAERYRQIYSRLGAL